MRFLTGLFDQYVVSGFATKTLELLPANADEKGIAELEHLEEPPIIPGPGPRRALAIVASGGGACPWVAQCWFIKEQDGWKLTLDPERVKKKEDFLDWYERAISKQQRGRAKELEGQPVEQPAPRGR